MRKRVLATLLCLCMVLCMIPLSASTAEVETPKVYVALGDSIPAGYGLAETETAYPKLLADANGLTLENLAATGETSTTLLAKLADPETLAKVKAASLITLTVGGNDLMDALYTYLANQYNAGKDEEAQLTKEEIQAKLLAGDTEVLTFAVTVAANFAESQEATTALTLYTENLVKIVGAIKATNPTATLLVTNQYNPYSYLAASQAANPLLGEVLKTVAATFEAGVTALNGMITYTAAQLQFAVVDVYTAFAAAEENPCNASVTDVTKINLDFHPNAYGHSLIAKVLDETINPLPFTDVPQDQWYYEAVRYAYFNDLMAGVGNGLFDPNAVLDRATVVQLLYNLEGQPEVEEITDKFVDVDKDIWYAEEVTWAAENDVVAGYGDGIFQPEIPVTREAFAQMLYNYAKYKKYDLEGAADLSKYSDGDTVSNWAETAMAWANGNQLINGNTDGTLAPQAGAQRAHAASILSAFCENIVAK